MITIKNTKAEILAAYQELLEKQEAASQEAESQEATSQEATSQEEKKPLAELIAFVETLQDTALKYDVLGFFKKFQKGIEIVNRPLSENDKGRIYKVYREVASVYHQLSINDILGSINTLEPLLHIFSDEHFYDEMVKVFWEIHDRILQVYPPAREVKFSEDLTASAVCALITMLDEEEVKKLNVFIHTQKAVFNRINGSIKD